MRLIFTKSTYKIARRFLSIKLQAENPSMIHSTVIQFTGFNYRRRGVRIRPFGQNDRRESPSDLAGRLPALQTLNPEPWAHTVRPYRFCLDRRDGKTVPYAP